MISTPELAGTILPGITRNSIIQLARSRGYEVFTSSFVEAAIMLFGLLSTVTCPRAFSIKIFHLARAIWVPPYSVVLWLT